MKRTLIVLIFLCVFLCGCAELYYEPEQTILISAIGIDENEQGVLLTVETVDTSKPDGSSEYSPKTFEIVKKDCESAFNLLQKSLGNKLTAEHCVLVVKGEKTEEKLFYETLLYLSKSQDLSQNTKIVTAESANQMLCTKSHTGQAVGYDAVKILNLQEERKDLLSCNLYSVLRALESGNTPTLPLFKTENDSYFLEGMKNE